jgi:translation initiation factor 2 beta subunit (eIF-2beta)/eIF-5
MAKWYDEYLTEQEKARLQVGQKGIRARRRKEAQESNVRNAQQQTLERERQQGAAYANKMQKDTARSKEILQNAFAQDAYQKSKKKR